MIEVGEYVKIKEWNVIGKILKVTPRKIYIDSLGFGLSKEQIAKASKNITDLIKVGDVISYRIDNISTTLETKGYIEGIVDIADNEMLQEIKENKDYCIKSILTREQFAQAEYKIKEDK